MENKIHGLDPGMNLGPIGLEIKREMETYFEELKKSMGRKRTFVIKAIEECKMDFAAIVDITHVLMTTSVAIGYEYTGVADKVGKDICKRYEKELQIMKANDDSNKAKDFQKAEGYSFKVNEEKRLRLGAFVIDVYVRLGLVIPKMIDVKSNNNGQKHLWMLYARNRAKLESLRKEFPKIDTSSYTLTGQANDWTNGISKNDRGIDINLIRGVNPSVINRINKTETPLLINAINRKQAVEYSICKETYDILKWCFETKQEVFDFFHNKFMNADARKSKLGQNQVLINLAEDILSGNSNSFFQRYFCDFRGRIYPEAKYLNEIGTDSAKGLLKLKNGKPLGDYGKNYLFHHIANCHGFDKESHEDKVQYVTDRFEEFVNYGLSPKAYPGWMKADAPFQFLNGCIELSKLWKWLEAGNKVEDFVSNTICYFDGSNNGAQWLFALAKDSKNSHLVNVIKSPDGKFGDFYKYVGKRVFDKIKSTEVTDLERYNFNKYLKHMFRRRKQWREIYDELYYAKSGKAHLQRREEIVKDKLSKFQAKYKKQLKTTNVLYWQYAIDQGIMTPKEFRAIVKRPCMTFAYSGTVRGFAQQILDDSDQFENEYIQNKQFSACFLLAELIYATIEEDFPELVSIRNYLTEVAGKFIDKHGENINFKTVISNFPFTNNYHKSKRMKLALNFYTVNNSGNIEYGIHRIWYESDSVDVDKRKSKLGISPNFVHQLDALHLQLVVNDCPFDIVSAHDSYGCLPSDAKYLNRSIRECMVRVLEADPILDLSQKTGNLVELPLTGDLNIKDILDSEFAFA